MTFITLLDLAITLAAAYLGLRLWPKANTAWKFVIAGVWVILFGSISRALAFFNVIPDPGWGVTIASIPIIMVLYICGSEALLLLGLWNSRQ
jgi:hypothetical protein